jgi:hypothetical protein
VQSAGVSGTFRIGVFTAIPYIGTAVIVMVLLLGANADRHANGDGTQPFR